MNHPCILFAATWSLLASVVPVARAQPRLATELLAGVGTGAGRAVPRPPDFLALGVAVVAGVAQVGPAQIMTGLSISRQFNGPSGDLGYRQPDGRTIGGPWPFFRSLSAVAALDLTAAIAARATAGVGAFRDNFGYTTGGFAGSLDLTIPGRTPAGLLLSGSGTVLPGYRGGEYRTRSLGIGLRFSTRSNTVSASSRASAPRTNPKISR